jgi:predicted RNA-binding protein with TRAM domain
MNSNPKPVETGSEYTVDITGIGRDGEGIARIGGLLIFVKNVKAGDKNIKIKVNSVFSNFAIAEVVTSSTDTT